MQSRRLQSVGRQPLQTFSHVLWWAGQTTTSLEGLFLPKASWYSMTGTKSGFASRDEVHEAQVQQSWPQTEAHYERIMNVRATEPQHLCVRKKSPSQWMMLECHKHIKSKRNCIPTSHHAQNSKANYRSWNKKQLASTGGKVYAQHLDIGFLHVKWEV